MEKRAATYAEFWYKFKYQKPPMDEFIDVMDDTGRETWSVKIIWCESEYSAWCESNHAKWRPHYYSVPGLNKWRKHEKPPSKLLVSITDRASGRPYLGYYDHVTDAWYTHEGIHIDMEYWLLPRAYTTQPDDSVRPSELRYRAYDLMLAIKDGRDRITNIRNALDEATRELDELYKNLEHALSLMPENINHS